jgi:hypothetical protein
MVLGFWTRDKDQHANRWLSFKKYVGQLIWMLSAVRANYLKVCSQLGLLEYELIVRQRLRHLHILDLRSLVGCKLAFLSRFRTTVHQWLATGGNGRVART